MLKKGREEQKVTDRKKVGDRRMKEEPRTVEDIVRKRQKSLENVVMETSTSYSKLFCLSQGTRTSLNSWVSSSSLSFCFLT